MSFSFSIDLSKIWIVTSIIIGYNCHVWWRCEIPLLIQIIFSKRAAVIHLNNSTYMPFWVAIIQPKRLLQTLINWFCQVAALQSLRFLFVRESWSNGLMLLENSSLNDLPVSYPASQHTDINIRNVRKVDHVGLPYFWYSSKSLINTIMAAL